MKRLIATVLTLIMIIGFTNISSAAIPGYTKPARPIRVYISDKQANLTLPILVNNGRTLYPFRELLETIGAQVSYDGASKTAIAAYNGITLKFPIGKNTYYVNDSAKTMDTKSVLDAAIGRTYIPIRYAFEALGYTVQFISSQKHDEIRIYNLGEYSLPDDKTFVDKYYNAEHTDTIYYSVDVDNHRLVFRDEYADKPYTNYVLNSSINPDINRQVIDATKALADDNQFVYDIYIPKDTSLPGHTAVVFAKGAVQEALSAEYFKYIFEDTNYFDLQNDMQDSYFSDKVFLTLILNRLYWNHEEAQAMSTPFFAKKLRDSLIAMFGSDIGIQIFSYIYEQYIKVMMEEDFLYYANKNYRDKKIFGNMQVVFSCTNTNKFYFSYVK